MINIQLTKGDVRDIAGERHILEREMGSGFLSFMSERTSAPYQIELDTGEHVTPTWTWFREEFAAGRIRRLSPMPSRLAQRQAMAREDDYDAIMARDPDALVRQIVLDSLDRKTSISKSDEAIRRELAAIWEAKPRHLAGKKPPSPSTVRYWLKNQRLGRRCRGEPQMGLRVLAPTGSGKSTAALAYIAFVESQRPRTETFIPVIKIELERNSTSKKLMMAILNALGDAYSHHGNELALKRRVLEYFKRFGVELLIVDEVQHLNYRDSPKNDVTDTLKVLLDTGVVPIAFLGTPEAKVLFERNLQLNGRLLPPCDLLPLDSKRAGDRDLFARFVDRLDHAIVEQGILPNLSNLESAGLLPVLFEVSDGVVGRVSRLLQVALEAALRRNAQCLERADISWAIDHWAVPQSFVKANPLIGATYG